MCAAPLKLEGRGGVFLWLRSQVPCVPMPEMQPWCLCIGSYVHACVSFSRAEQGAVYGAGTARV